MRIGVVVFLLLLIPIVYAQEEYQNYQSIDVNSVISSNIKLNSGINYFSSELLFYPREAEFQSVEKKEYSGDVIEKTDYILYEWNNPPEELNFYMDYDIKSGFNSVKIKNKIPFPIEDIPYEYQDYLEDTELIKSNNVLIKEKAEGIMGDEDDLYEAVHKVASWVKEDINYSLETLTEEITQDSVWVLQNEKGVCDEITVLFIAMLRSQGIPAKFISGSSYTDVIPGFGNHAWAEVYFPGKGWVPFDVTYGQYGYVDATHIKMMESIDAKEPSVRYRWSPGNKNIEVDSLNISTTIVSTGILLPKYVNIKLNVLNDKIKSGSYLPVEIELENTQDYYLSDVLYIVKAPKEIENNVKSVLLKPNEKKKIYWILNLPDGLDDQYIYTSKIEMIDFFHNSGNAEIEYANKYIYYPLNEAEEKIYQLELENRNPESTIDLFCKPDKIKYYPYENATLICKLTNDDEDAFQFDLCFMKDCENIVINPSEKKEIRFDIPSGVESREYHAQISNSEMIKNSYFDVKIIEVPDSVITGLNYPEEIKYRDSGEIKFDLEMRSPAKNLVIYINNKELFRFDVYEGNENFILPFNAKYFYRRPSKLIFEYEDDNGLKYSREQVININVINVPFYVKISYGWILIIIILIIAYYYKGKLFKLKEPPSPKRKKSSRTYLF